MAHSTYVGKEYCLDAWWDGYNALTYADREAFVVDNTFIGLQYLKTLQDKGIPSVHLQPYRDQQLEYTLHAGWELIAEHARDVEADWIYSVEADNGPAPESLEKMHAIARYANLHLVTHDYPMHASAVEASGMKGDEFYYTEFGCLLMTRQLLERALAEYDTYKYMAHAVFRTNEKYRGGHCRMCRTFPVAHWDGYQYEFPQFPDPPENDPDLFYPTPVIPADFGSVLPPSLAYLAAKES